MRNTVHVALFDGVADHEVALALTEIGRPGDYRIRTVGITLEPVLTGSGLSVRPDLPLEAIEPAQAALLVIPGGDLWQRGDGQAWLPLLPRLWAAGVPLAGIGAGVLPLARAGLLDRRRHTGNRPGYIDAFAPGYAGADQYDSTVVAVSDDGVSTASGLAAVEFARELIGLLDLYDRADTEHWYRMFKHATPPPSLADVAAV